MQNKNFFETAILNQTGQWNGYAQIGRVPNSLPRMDSLLRLLGFTMAGNYKAKFEKLFHHSFNNVHYATFYRVPLKIGDITIVDKNLESNYGIINAKSLKTIRQCNIQYSNEDPSKEMEYNTDLKDLKIWLLFNVRPSIKLEKRSFHMVSVWLNYIYDHCERNVPCFEIQVSIPKCLVKESIKNPEFMKELRMKLGF